MVKISSYNDFTIEVFDDPTYKYESADNVHDYKNAYFGKDAQEYPASKHGIRILKDGDETNSCVIIGSAGATGIHENSFLIDNDQLVICCCNTIFCLSLPDLSLRWSTIADWSTCFSIHKLESDYIVHGEMVITRLSPGGKIIWEYGGRDIFVSIDSEGFQINTDHIEVLDFYNMKYKIGFDGKSID